MPSLLDRMLGRRPAPMGEALLGRYRTRGGLTAAGMLVTPEVGQRLAKAGTSREWQKAAFAYRRALPEVGYVMRWLANNATHIRLYAGDRPPGEDEVAELNDDYEGNLPPELRAAAQEALTRLTGAAPSGGGAAVLAPIFGNYETVGECWLVGRYDPERDRETWAVHSVSELKFQDGRFPGMDPDGPRGYYRLVTGEGRDAEAVDLDPSYTTVYRLWTADPEWSSMPDSPMRTLVGVCERLLLIEKGDDASLRSRAAGNGILLYPEEADAVPYGDEDEPVDDPIAGDLTTQLTAPLTRDGSAAQVVPMFHRMRGDYIDKVRHLTFDRPLDEELNEREARLLARLGIGLDVPPEVITGLADTNHWNAWQITSDSFKHHVEPLTIAAVEALTLTYMRGRLLAAGFDDDLVDRVVIWYDPAGLVAQADMSDAANDAWDRQLITGRAWRELRGIDESAAPPEQQQTDDAPIGSTGMTADRLSEVARVAGELIRAGFAAESVAAALGLPGIAHTGLVPVTVKPPEDDDAPPAGDGEVEAEVVSDVIGEARAIVAAAAVTDEQRRLARRLVKIEQALRERIAAAAAAAITRALERAGNRVRATGQRDDAVRTASAGVPGDRVTAAVGRALVAALGLDEQQLLAEAFGRLREQYVEWTEAAAEEAIDTAARIARVDRADPGVARAVAELRDRFHDNIEASWPTMETGLNDLAAERLYDPDPAAPEVGELPPTIVPPGLVREALAQAGGLLADATGRPPLNGLTSGELLDRFLRDAGTEVVEYEWSYGISARPFSPHLRLDGVVFTGFDDPALSTAGTGHEWVGGSFAPGDHRGCHCDYAPIYADGGNARDELEAIGRRAYVEQNPDLPVPTRGATVDPRLYLDPARARPEQSRTPAAAAAQTARDNPPPAVPVQRSRAAATRTRRGPRVDEAGVPYRLTYEYLGDLSDEQLDDLTDHLVVRIADGDPIEGRRWDDLETYLAHREGWARIEDDLTRGDARDADWQAAWDDWNDRMGRAGLTHDAERRLTRREVQEEYTLFVEAYYVDAERATRGSILNDAGELAYRQGRLADPRDLVSGPVSRVYRWASEELLTYMETHPRLSWSQFYYDRTGSPSFAATAAKHAEQNARINRDRTDKARSSTRRRRR